MLDLQDFLVPITLSVINEDEGFVNGQLGQHVLTQSHPNFDIALAHIVIVGVTETRGNGTAEKQNNAADIIRKHLYRLHYWHTDVVIADAGNIEVGATLTDSYAAIKTVLEELYRQNKTVIILGGSHDVTLAQYAAYHTTNKMVEATGIDAAINLRAETAVPAENFLLEMFTGEPNLLKHYNHIGFQSYLVHPDMLQTIDKLRFDCYRLGVVKQQIEEMEPILRSTDMVTIDISAIKYSDAPANKNYPNGFTGVDACTLTQYAGLSCKVNSLGMYGYSPAKDVEEITAAQIAQMLWYFFDGRYKRQYEVPLTEVDSFNIFYVACADVATTFMQSKRTGRWWMQMPDSQFIPCSHNDYITASKNQYPERWLRVQERN